MTQGQKASIRGLRESGRSYTSISLQTGLSVGTIKAYCSRNDIKPHQPERKGVCECCGNAMVSQAHTRAKRFCSAQCRHHWWRENRDKRVRNGVTHTCVYCKREYTSYNGESKFCSHPCYIAHRFGKGEGRP